jgi:hypothetical protein
MPDGSLIITVGMAKSCRQKQFLKASWQVGSARVFNSSADAPKDRQIIEMSRM